jgi:hypothetical protein
MMRKLRPEPRAQEQAERNPESSTDLKMTFPIILVRSERADRKQQRAERCTRRRNRSHPREKYQRGHDHHSAANSKHPGENSGKQSDDEKND